MRSPRLFLALVISVVALAQVSAADRTWDGGGGDNNWTTVANWDGNVTAPSAGDNLIFAGNTQTTNNNDFTAGTSFNSIRFSVGAGNFVLGGNSITLAGGTSAIISSVTSGTMTIGNNLLFSADPTFTAATGGNLTLSGTITTGGRTIRVEGGGLSTLSGVISGSGSLHIESNVHDSLVVVSAVNTFTGNVLIQYGGLRITNSSALGVGPKIIQVLNGSSGQSSLRLDGSGGAITLAANLSFQTSSLTGNYGGIINEAGANTISGNFSLVTGGGGTRLRVDGGSLTVSGTVTPASTTRELVLDGVGNGTFSGVLQDNGVNIPLLRKEGAGSWTLSGANSYTGVTTVNAGTVLNGASGVIPNLSAVTVASGATYNLNGYNETIGSLAGAGTVAIGAATLTTGGDNSSTTHSGPRTGTASGLLTKIGSGVFTLTGTPTYAGKFSITGGTISVADRLNLSPVPSPAMTDWLTINGATLEVTGTTDFGPARGFVLGASGGTVSVTGANTPNIGGVISGSGALIKTGTGTLSVLATNTYSGATTISAGTLTNAAAAVIPDTSAVSVASGATWNLNSFAETITSLAGAGNVTLGSATLTTGSAASTFSGIISGTGGLTKQGTAAFTLSGANTYDGVTAVNAGTLIITNNSALGSAVGGTVVVSGDGATAGGELRVDSAAGLTLAEPLSLTGQGNSGYGGALRIAQGDHTWSGAITLPVSDGARIQVDDSDNAGSSSVTITGGITGATASYLNLAAQDSVSQITVTTNPIVISSFGFLAAHGGGAAGRVTLAVAGNTFDRAALHYGITFRTGVDNALPSGVDVQVGTTGSSGTGPNATFDLYGHSQTIDRLFGGNAPGEVNPYGTRSVTNSVAATTATLTIGNANGTSLFDGVISNGAGTVAITKVGSGTFDLHGANTYSGISTLSNGTLRASADVITSTAGALGNAASAVVLAGGTFESNTTTVSRPLNVIGPVTVAAYGVARTISSPITTTSGVVAASFVASSLRAVTQDDWRATQTITGTRMDGTITFNTDAFGTGAERAAYGIGGSDAGWDNFSVQWDGYLHVATAGTTIYTRSDDGSRMWIDLDDDGVVDGGEWGSNDWGNGHGETTVALHSGLAIGIYRMRIQYEEGNGGNRMHLLWGDLNNSAGTVDNLAVVPANMMVGLKVGSDGPDLTLSGVISGGGSVVKIGSDHAYLAGANTYTGATIVSNGTLQNLAAGVVPDVSRVVLHAAGNWNLDSFNETAGSVHGAGPIALGTAALTAGGDNTSATYTGVISGSGSLTKNGTGTWTLGGASTYTGTSTINAGTVQANADVVASTNGPLGNAASAIVLAGGGIASNTTTFSRTISVTGNGTSLVAVGVARTVSSLIDIVPDNGPLIASFVNSSLRAVSEDDWRVTRTITGTRSDTTIYQPINAFGTAAQRAAYGIGGSDGDWSTFSVQWDGYLRVVTPGTNLYTRSDDGSRVWLDLDDDGVVDSGEWGSNGWGTGQAPTTRLLHAGLAAGTYRIRVQYEDDGGNNEMYLLWNDVANSGGAIDTQYLVPTNFIAGFTVGDDGPNLALTGVISGNGALGKAGTNVVTVSGANTYTGTTHVAAGTLRLGANDTIPNAQVQVAGGATFDLSTHTDTIGSLAGAGSVMLDTASVLSTGADGLATTYRGVISGAGAMVKQGAGIFTLGGANSYDGTTTISAGGVTISHATGLGSTTGGTTVASGANLTIAGVTVGAEAVTLSGTGIASAGALVGSGTAALGGAVTLAADASINTSGTFSVTGAVGETGGVRTLTKLGAGTVIVAGANTYTGATTVTAGTLLVNGNSAVATGAVGVASGATIGGTGTIGGVVTVSSGGTFAPGSTSAATTTIAAANTSLNLSAGSTSAFTLGTASDQIVCSGTTSVITLGGTLGITDGGGLAPGTYTLMTFTGSTTSGTFSSLTMPTGFTGVVSIDNVTTHSVILTVDLVNTGLTVAPGGAVVAMTSNLSAAQSGSSTAQIVYTLTTPPLHGSLRKNLVLLGTNDTFTQADIDNNLVSYEHGDLAQASDSFTVDIAGAGGAIATRTVAVTVSGTGLANSLMAYLPFEQTSGTVAPDVAGSYTGTVGGTAAWSAGQIGNALTFNGSSTYVQLPSGMADFTAGLTISVWARPTASPNYARFIDFANGAGSDNILLSRAGTGSDLTFQIYTGATQSAVTDGTVLTNGAWHHYLVSSTSGGATYRFKDGTQLNAVANLTTIPNLTRTLNFIGRSNWPADGLFQGQMDEVRVYNRALTAGEVKLLSQQAAPTFANLDGDTLVYAGTGSAVALDVGGNATVSDADDLHFSTGYLLIANQNAVATSALSVATAGGITTSGATVSFGGNVIGTIDGTLNGASGAHLKIAFTTQYATSTAVRDLVRAVRFSDTVAVQRTFSVTLSDGMLAPVPATVTMTASSALSLTTNTGLNLAAGGVGAFSAAHLTATSTVGQTAAQITYTLTTAPTHGVLRNNLVAIAVSGTFTQANIDSGLISYEHGNLGSLSDSFQVTVSDSLSNNGGQSMVAITATGIGLGSGLVGYWPFDDGSGTSAVDRSGSKYHATLFNTPTWAAGQLGGALTFNGSTQYGSFPRPVQDDFTIVTWFKSTSTGAGNSGSAWTGGSGLVDAEVGGVVNDFGLSYAGAGYVLAGVGNVDTTARQSNSYNDDVWHQASFTRSRSGQAIALRVDNNAAVTALINGNSLTAPSAMNFARLQTGLNYYNGSLDDVRIYNRVLTSDELTAIYQSTTDAAPAFANLNGDSVLMTAANTAFAIDTGTVASVSDSDDLSFSGGYVLVENVTGGVSTTLSIATVGLITTSGVTVSYNGNAIGTIDGTLGGAAGASLKVLFTTTAATPTAVSALVRALRCADTTAVPDHTLRITLSDGLLSTSATTTAYGNLFLTANTGVTVAAGAMVTVDATALTASQSSATTAQVVYTVTALPTHGYLRKSKVALAASGTFTQADVANNLISFEHGDLAFTSDSFQVTIAGTNGAAIGTTTVAITVAGSGLALNLQARWRLDDGSGTTVSDATGNGHVGTAVNPTWIAGRLNGGLTFSGNGDVRTGNAAALRPAAAISVSGWFRTGSTAAVSVIRHDEHFTALQTLAGANAQVALWPGGVLQTYEFPWNGVWNDDAWHHYAVSYHQANGLRIYFDGALTHSTGTYTGALSTSTAKPFIMGAAEYGAEYYDGDLDEVRFYDRVIGGGEVRLLAEQAVPLLANLDGDTANYTEDAAAIAIDNATAAAFSDSDDLTLAGGYLLVDNVTASTGAAISIATTASITTSGATVNFDGNAIGTIDGTFTGAGGVDLRINFTTDEASPAAVTALIQALRYQDLQGPTGARVLGVSVNDGVFTSATATVTITVTSVNDTPVIAANTGLTVASGKVVAVTPTNLLVTDQDNTAAQLAYTVTAIPAHGYLRKDLVAMAANDTFTQEDIANQRLSYEHGTLAQTSDGFTFTVSDGVGGNIGATSVTITVAGSGLLNGLVAYWKLDETSGTTAVDATGNGLVGTHSNGPTPATGRLNGDLSFNRAALQSVTVAYDAQLALSTYTVSVLIKPASTANENGILGTRTNSDHTFDLKWEANRIHGDIGDGTTWLSTAADIGAGQGGTLSTGTWYLVTYVVDNTNQNARLYLDGSLRATVPFTGTPLLMSPGQILTIGNSGGLPGVPGNEHAHGEIDDVRIYGRALSGSEVQTLWEQAMPVIANLDGDAPTYTEGAAAVALDTGTAVAVSDSDDLTLAGGYLLVENTTGSATDTLSVTNVGSGAGQIGVSGSTISFQGAVIGTIDGTDDGATGADLRIGFTTDDATPAAVTALIQALRFADSSQTPSATSRILRVTVSDNQFSSVAATVTLAMSSVPDVLTRITVDADGDGHLDAIRITFDQALNDNFTAITVTVAGYTAATPVTGAVANDAIIEVPLTELVSGDTGATPAVRITINTSLAGTATSTLIPVEGSGTVATDAAAPVLLSTAWTDAGTGGVSAGDTVTLTFSESVTTTTLLVGHLGLPVSGDTLSTTTIANQTTSVITMTLAGTPQLSPGQAYSSGALSVGHPSGVFIATATAIRDAVMLAPATGNAASARDLGSSDLLAIAWVTGSNPKAWVLGSVALSHVANTATAGLDLALHNIGASTANLAIAVSDSAPSSWQPAAAAGIDAFMIKVDNASLPAGDPTDPAAYELTLSNSGQSLVANLLSGVATDFEFFIGLPTAITSGGGVQQTTTVTITATLPP